MFGRRCRRRQPMRSVLEEDRPFFISCLPFSPKKTKEPTMNSQETVANAVKCLRDLETRAAETVEVADISRRQDVPLNICLQILRRLSKAAIVAFVEENRVRLLRSLEELDSIELLDAVWLSAPQTAVVEMLFGAEEEKRLALTQAAAEYSAP